MEQEESSTATNDFNSGQNNTAFQRKGKKPDGAAPLAPWIHDALGQGPTKRCYWRRETAR